MSSPEVGKGSRGRVWINEDTSVRTLLKSENLYLVVILTKRTRRIMRTPTTNSISCIQEARQQGSKMEWECPWPSMSRCSSRWSWECPWQSWLCPSSSISPYSITVSCLTSAKLTWLPGWKANLSQYRIQNCICWFHISMLLLLLFSGLCLIWIMSNSSHIVHDI